MLGPHQPLDDALQAADVGQTHRHILRPHDAVSNHLRGPRQAGEPPVTRNSSSARRRSRRCPPRSVQGSAAAEHEDRRDRVISSMQNAYHLSVRQVHLPAKPALYLLLCDLDLFAGCCCRIHLLHDLVEQPHGPAHTHEEGNQLRACNRMMKTLVTGGLHYRRHSVVSATGKRDNQLPRREAPVGEQTSWQGGGGLDSQSLRLDKSPRAYPRPVYPLQH